MIDSILATIKFGSRQVTSTFEVIQHDGQPAILLQDDLNQDHKLILPLNPSQIESVENESLSYACFYRAPLRANDAITVSQSK